MVIAFYDAREVTDSRGCSDSRRPPVRSLRWQCSRRLAAEELARRSCALLSRTSLPPVRAKVSRAVRVPVAPPDAAVAPPAAPPARAPAARREMPTFDSRSSRTPASARRYRLIALGLVSRVRIESSFMYSSLSADERCSGVLKMLLALRPIDS